MAGETRNAVLARELRTLFGFGLARDWSDRQLLERFLTVGRAEAEEAFTFLVERHGPMVLDVCRHVLDDSHDAQDAFQATFLVLLRRARSIRNRDSLASWLFGVAMRVARRARYAAIARRFHERKAGNLASKRATSSNGHPECLAALHDEIARLPERFREPIVLCHLEGLSTAAAAHRLGCAHGTILSRLARGRERLRRRLIQRGLAFPAGLLAAPSVSQATLANLPAALATSTVEVAGRALAGRAALAAAVSISVSALTEATLRTLLMSRISLATALLATAAAVATVSIPYLRPTLGAGSRVAFSDERLQPSDRVDDLDAMARRDLDLLQGAWYRVSSETAGKKWPAERNGQPIPPKDPALMIVFKGDGWYQMGADGKTLVQGHIVRLDTTRRPKAIDLYNLGPGRNPPGRAWIEGIYKLEDDTLTLCLSFGGVDRPAEFATKAGPNSFVLDVYQRDRPPIKEQMINARGLEDALYKILKRDHEFSDPLWSFVITLRDLQDKTLIDATFKHRPKGKVNEFDAVIQARRAVLRVDRDAKTVRVFLDGPQVEHFARDAEIVVINNKVLEIPIPTFSHLTLERASPPPAQARSEGRIVMMDSDQALSLAYSRDGKTLATAGFDGIVHLWDAVNGKQIGELKGEKKSTIRSVTFAPDGKTVACVNDAGLVRLWDVATGALKQSFSALSEPMRAAVGTFMLDSLAFAPDGRLLAVSGFGPTHAEPPDRIYELRVFDVQAGQPEWSHMGRGEQACSLAYAADGETLARGGWKTVTLWNAKDGEPIRTLYPTKGTIFALAFTPNGRTLVGGGNIPTEDVNHQAGLVTLWDVATGRIVHTLEGHRGGVHAVAIAPDGKTVASGGDGPMRAFPGVTKVISEVRLWDIATGSHLWTFEGESGVVRGFAFAPDGKALVYCDDASVGVIKVQTAKIDRTLTTTTLTPQR
jgi:RNA polymerase sigma factor (sigma-70 family)